MGIKFVILQLVNGTEILEGIPENRRTFSEHCMFRQQILAHWSIFPAVRGIWRDLSLVAISFDKPICGLYSYVIIAMARFSANITDSSEDEDELYMNQPQEPPKKLERSRPALPTPIDVEEDSDEDAASSSSSSSEMQEDELMASPRRKRPALSRNALIEDDGAIRYAHEVTKRPPSKKSPPRQQRGNPTIIPWAQTLGVDAQKMHVMQTSLFRMPEEAAAMQTMNSRPATSAKRLHLPPQSMNRKHSRGLDGDGSRMNPKEVRDVQYISNSISDISDLLLRGPRLLMTSSPPLITLQESMRGLKAGRPLSPTAKVPWWMRVWLWVVRSE